MQEPGICMRFVVYGRVQGVGFRDSVHRAAKRVGELRGFVRNLPDGSVEIWVAGEAARVGELREYIGRGPPLARVDRIEGGPGDPPLALGPFTVVRG